MCSHNVTILLVVAVPQIIPIDHAMVNKTAKAQELLNLTLYRLFKVKVNDSTIRKRLNKFGLFGRVARERFVFFKNEHGSMT